ncbi:MAG: zf-TFIIB domain-containing protein [Candidatus Omnitrophica bacterium]|nr:zf-TFIIB domain-containing protein [Candidatus Omnitrophota bacterium]
MNNFYNLVDAQKKTVRRVAQRKGQTMLCPKCRKPLVVTFERDIVVDLCEQCHGIWVGRVDEKRLLNVKVESFSMDELSQFRKAYQPWGRMETSGYVPCPVCRELMYRKNWGSYSGVMVDKCSEHGTWYDEGKFEKVREYVSLGGIEYEKLRVMEKGLEELDSRLYKEVKSLDGRLRNR